MKAKTSYGRVLLAGLTVLSLSLLPAATGLSTAEAKHGGSHGKHRGWTKGKAGSKRHFGWSQGKHKGWTKGRRSTGISRTTWRRRSSTTRWDGNRTWRLADTDYYRSRAGALSVVRRVRNNGNHATMHWNDFRDRWVVRTYRRR